MNVTLIFDFKNGTRKVLSRGTKSRFMKRVSLGCWKILSVTVRYGKRKDVYGHTVEFMNEGIYTNKHDAKEALKAFLE